VAGKHELPLSMRDRPVLGEYYTRESLWEEDSKDGGVAPEISARVSGGEALVDVEVGGFYHFFGDGVGKRCPGKDRGA
jgi:hypothetical protein